MNKVCSLIKWLCFPGVLLLASCATPDADPEDVLGRQFSVFSGIQLVNIDHTVRPQDDLYRYANGHWLATFILPEDRSGFGVFTALSDRTEGILQQIVNDIITKDPAHLTGEEANLKNLYSSFMNQEAVNQKGLGALAPRFGEIDTLGNHAALAKVFASFSKFQLTQPFHLFVEENPENSRAFVFHLEQGGVALPGRLFYSSEGPEQVAMHQAYLAYIARIFTLAEFGGAEARAERVFKLEQALAAIHRPLAETRDHDLNVTVAGPAALASRFPGFDWEGYFDALGYRPPGRIVVHQPAYFAALGAVINRHGVQIWQDYLRFQLLNDFAGFLPENFARAQFEFFQQTLRAIALPTPRERIGFNLVNTIFADTLGQIYVRENLDPAVAPKVRAMARNLKAAFRQKLIVNDWLSPATRARAIEKLDKLTIRIGGPETWRNYAGLNLAADDLVANILEFQAFDFADEVKKISQGSQPGRWPTAPQTVNAYYNPAQNEIVIPAAILVPPFFNPDVDNAANYGALGGIIGHEITHAFDDQGRKFDGDGNQVNWWTAADETEFKARAEMVARLYSQLVPSPGLAINGDQTLGENIGDIEGLGLALAAYKISLGGARSSTLAGFSGEQRVFLGWAQLWAQKLNQAELRNRLLTGLHSPGEFRVNVVVSNLPEFYRAFNLAPGDGLFIPEDQRLGIW